MGTVAFAILFILLFVFSIYIGFLLGSAAGERAVSSREYWVFNIAGVVVAMILTALLTLIPLLAATPLGLLAGWIAGLKIGFGESVGPWKAHDRFLRVNRSQREPGQVEAARKHRRRTRSGESAPDLISIEKNGAASGASGQTPAGRSSSKH